MANLTKEDIIKNGSIFTPNYIVELVYDMVLPYIKRSSVIADFCSGYGAFLDKFNDLNNKCIGTEFDEKSYNFLIQNFDNNIYF